MSKIIKFKTNQNNYLYEPLYNKLHAVDTEQYSNAEIYLKNSIEHLSSEFHHPLTDQLEERQTRQLGILVLQVTQACNLLCDYCPYANISAVLERSHKNKHMTFETAKKAIDFYFSNSMDSLGHMIDFYGGEPFINFKTIKEIVSYCEKSYVGRDIIYKITSNGTLITDKIIEFLVKKDFVLTLSIDGIKEVNDLNRKFVDGNKSVFDSVIGVISLIEDCYPQYLKKNVSLNIVIDPQVSLDLYLQMFVEYPYLKDIKSIIGINKSDEYLEKKNTFSEEYITTYNYLLFLCLLEIFFEYEFEKETLLFEMLKESIADIVLSDSFLINQTEFVPGGQCIPGISKLFVNTGGSFFPCERVSELNDRNNIGNLTNGFDTKKSKEMLNFTSVNKDNCKKCPAIRHCGNCVASIRNEGDYNSKNFENICKATIDFFRENLKIKALLQEIASNEIYKILEE